MTISSARGCESKSHCWPPPSFRQLIIASNIWSPLDNIGTVKAIAAKYKFSTRLQGTIVGWDEAKRQVAEKIVKKPMPKVSVSGDVETTRQPRPRRTFHARSADDPEKGSVEDGEEARRFMVARSLGLDKLHQEDLHMYKLLQEQYNYTTIDHGSNCKSDGRKVFSPV